MNDLISIIVTSYNHAEFLPQRLNSLLAQTYRNLEIIVIDDCSTDNSAEVLKTYEGKPGVKITFLNANGGYAAACNLGVSLSHGNYIIFAECDDFSEPDQVETLHSALCSNPSAGVAYSRSRIVDIEGKIIKDDYLGRSKAFRKLCSSDVLLPKRSMQLFLLESCVIPNMSAALIKKDLINEIGGISQDFKVCADWDLWCRIAGKSDFYYISRQLSNFRSHPTTARNTISIELQISEVFKLLNKAANNYQLPLLKNMWFSFNMGKVLAYYTYYYKIGNFGDLAGILFENSKYDVLLPLYYPFGLLSVIIDDYSFKIKKRFLKGKL